MNRLSASFVGLLSLSALLGACSGGSSEATTPQTSASASAAPPPATATASAAVETPPATSATAVAVTPPAPEPGADLKLVAMKMTMGAKGGTLELKADGTVWASKPGAKPAQIGNFAKNTLNITDGKAGTIAVWKDNTVTAPGTDKKASFDDKDALVGPDGMKITIDDKGKIELVKADGTKDAKTPAPTFTGFKPEARRAALLLTVLFLMADERGEAKAAPVTTPPKPAPAPAPAKH